MNQIRAGSILSYIQMACSAIITVFYTPVMINLLGDSEYGLYNTVSSVISVIALLNLGFGSSYIKYYSKLKIENNTEKIYRLNGMFLCIFLVISFVVLLCGLVLLNNLHMIFDTGLTVDEYVVARKLFAVLIVNLAISLPMNAFTCIISAREKFVFLKLVGLLKTVASPLLALPILLLGFRSVGMVLSTLALSVICDIIYLIYVFGVLKERFIFTGFDQGIFKEIFTYTVFIAIHLIVDQVNWHLDKTILGRYRGTYEVALYSVGASLAAHYMTVGTAFISLFTPRVHSIISENQKDKVKLKEKLTALFIKVGKIQYLIIAPIAIAFIFWGKNFILYWVGNDYVTTSYYVALLLIIPGSIDLIQNIGIEIQRAQNLHKFRAVIYAVMALINIVISIVLCRNYGAVGCAIGTGLSFVVVQGLIVNIYYHKKCNIDIIAFWKHIAISCKSLLLPTIFGVLCKAFCPEIGLFELIVQAGLFCGIYAVSLYFFGLDDNERNKIKNILLKRKKT